MKCRAITQDRGDSFLRAKPHACQFQAVEDGLCKIHSAMRRRLPGQIAKLEREIEGAREKLASLIAPETPDNPS